MTYLPALQQFIPRTLENRAALRTAIAALAAVLIAFALHVDKPYWSGMTVVILANIYTGNIIDKALMRIAGSIIGAWAGFFIAGFIANSFALYLLANFSLIAMAVYYYNFSRYAYAYLLAALSAFLVISEVAVNPEQAFYIAIWRPVDIGLGVLVSAASAFCLFPNNIYENVNKEVKAVFNALTNLLDQTEQLLISNDPKAFIEVDKQTLLLKKKIRKATEMLDFMRREIGFERVRIDQFRFLLDAGFGLCRTISFFTATVEHSPGQKLITDELVPVRQLFQAMKQDLNTLSVEFFSKPADITLQSRQALNQFDSALNTALANSGSQLATYLAVSHFLRQIHDFVLNLSTVLTDISSKRTNASAVISNKEQLRSDPDVMVHGIKAGLSATMALAFWLLADWPGGLNGIVSSIVISIRKTLFEMKNISAHRALGCMLGGGLALTVLACTSMDLYLLILLIFFGVWGFSYFSFKLTTYAYIGLQANIALIITLAQAGGPPLDLAPPLERLGGIFIGITTSFLVGNLIWRTDLQTMLQKQLKKLASYLRYNRQQIMLPAKAKLYDLTNAFWICRGLLESIQNQPLKPAKKALLDGRKETHEKLVLVQAAINHISTSLDQAGARNTAEKCGFDLSGVEQKIAQFNQDTSLLEYQSVLAELNQFSQLLLTGLQSSLPARDVENCAAYLSSLKQLTIDI
ncbi:FUSC family protein [Legionella dresdenensis]|uniref:FUSC family protein n=1 Tax=Legionella dresdenensis TaxID=450200 RepID=A0ABV8CCH6_9GAMM